MAEPWPIREVGHGMHSGAGTMLDEALAGPFAAPGILFVGYVT